MTLHNSIRLILKKVYSFLNKPILKKQEDESGRPKRLELTFLEVLFTIAICLIVIFLLTALNDIGWFDEEINRIFDVFSAVDQLLHPSPSPTKIMVVLIMQEDFDRIYQEKKFTGFIDRNYLGQLLQKISDCQPAVIGVDFNLDFCGENYDSLTKSLQQIHSNTPHPRIVLASTIVSSTLSPLQFYEIKLPYCINAHSEIRAGFDNIDAIKGRRLLLGVKDKEGIPHLSFAATIVAMKDDKFLGNISKKILSGSYDLRVNFKSRNRSPIHSTAFFDSSKTSNLADYIVIVGGSYLGSEDKHLTPIGETTGAELHANLVDNLLQKNYIFEPPHYVIWIIQFGFGFFIGFLFLRYPRSLLLHKAIPVVSVILLFALSWWIFNTIIYIFIGGLPAVFTGYYGRKRQLIEERNTNPNKKIVSI